MARRGIFTISLDFELYWGVRDTRPLASYGDAIVGVRHAVPALLREMSAREVHATWATVGFLFFATKAELCDHLPAVLPDYARRELSPYDYLASIGPDERSDPYHFGKSLVEQIAATPGMEIGTHTFSHFYCLEEGPSDAAFEADLRCWSDAARPFGAAATSIVFPRNQYTARHLEACRRLGITAFRGNPESWEYRAKAQAEQGLLRRGTRLVRTFVPSPATVVSEVRAGGDVPANVAASRFLRPSGDPSPLLDGQKIRTICREMSVAAETGGLYHLWWHPHNFGRNLPANMDMLRAVLDHFDSLRSRFDMRSLSMAEAAATASEVLAGT